MATTTLAAILTRVHTVMAALELQPARDAFSHDRQPASVMDQAYYLTDEGLGLSRSVTNSTQVRRDRIGVYVVKKLNFAPTDALATLHNTLVDIERNVKADGPNHSYHADLVGHRVTRPADKDYAVGSILLEVDYDFSEAVA